MIFWNGKIKYMTTITIPQKEYQKLVEKSLRYEYIRQMTEENLFSPPPIKNSKKIIEEFKKTGLYNQAFLKSLESGLKQSSYFKPWKFFRFTRNSKIILQKEISQRILPNKRNYLNKIRFILV